MPQEFYSLPMDSAEYPGRLYHSVPSWVRSGSPFHIRIRARGGHAHSLTSSDIAMRLLDSARQYHANGRWWCTLIVVMPDHVHAILSFPQEPDMAVTQSETGNALILGFTASNGRAISSIIEFATTLK